MILRTLYYNVLDLFSRGKGIRRNYSGHSVYIPARFHRYFEQEYEEANISTIDKHVVEGMTIIDVGAHIGLMSVILGQKTGKTGAVYSFEPTPSTFEVFKKTIRINNMDNLIYPENAAVSVKTGRSPFLVSTYPGDVSNRLVNETISDKNTRSIDMQLYAIDDYVVQKGIPKIDFIKIDAEGAELNVLKGAVKTLQQFSPRIILALHPIFLGNFNHSMDQIWDFIEQNGYEAEYQSRKIDRQDFISRTGLFDVFLYKNLSKA